RKTRIRWRTRRICRRRKSGRKCGRWRMWRWCCSIRMSSYMSIERGDRSQETGVRRVSRRGFLYQGLGSVALSALLHHDQARAGVLSLKPQQIPAKAKACIFLTMEGGPSHVDTFDPKPKLEKLHMTEFERKDKFSSAMESGTRYFVQS